MKKILLTLLTLTILLTCTSCKETKNDKTTELREYVVDYIRKEANINWSVKDDTKYFDECHLVILDENDNWKAFREFGSHIHDREFVPGVTYIGMPYTHGQANLYLFDEAFTDDSHSEFSLEAKSYIENSLFYKDGYVGLGGVDFLIGNDCSGAVYSAWSRVTSQLDFDDDPWLTAYLLPWKRDDILAVGDYYDKLNSHIDKTLSSSDQILKNAMFSNDYSINELAECFAKLKPGDGVIYCINGSGHIRMVSEEPNIVRKDDKTIDTKLSTIKCIGQGDGLSDGHGHNNLGKGITTWYEGDYSLDVLMSSYYIPVTIKALNDYDEEKEALTYNISLDNEVNNIYDLFKSKIECNYDIDLIEVIIKDGDEIIYDDTRVNKLPINVKVERISNVAYGIDTEVWRKDKKEAILNNTFVFEDILEPGEVLRNKLEANKEYDVEINIYPAKYDIDMINVYKGKVIK